MSDVGNLSKSELLTLLHTVERLSTETNSQKLVQTILDTACRLTNSPDGSILLPDPETNSLYFSAAKGEKAGELLAKFGLRSNQRVPLTGSVAGDTFTSQTIKNDKQAKRFKEVDRQTGNKSQSILSVPLCTRGKAIGVLQLLNKTDSHGKLLDYDAHDCLVVQQLARQAAIAIDNAQLKEMLLAHMGLYSSESSDLAARINQPAVREKLTLLFADMRGFTQVCRSLEATQAQQVVNELLTMYADQVLTFGGIVNKFMGDAVFAIFRNKDAPQNAVRCAFGMVDRFQSLRYQWQRNHNEDLSFLDLGIGIVTDDVAFGSVGSASVRDFTAVGTPVNLAHAFEANARDGRRILIDQATWTAVEELIADSDGPALFELKKPGEAAGVKFKQYHLKALKPEIPIRVFVSHNHRDRDLANQITRQLALCGIQTWYSNEDILPGENYIDAIRAGLMKSDWVLVIISKHSALSDWVRAEVKTALGDPRLRGRILPLVVDDSSSALIHPDLTTLQVMDGRTNQNLGEGIRDFLLTREKEFRSQAAAS
jgi:class 3 adenylate cyclase